MKDRNLQVLLENAEVRHYQTPAAAKTVEQSDACELDSIVEEAVKANRVDDIHRLCIKLRKYYGYDNFSLYMYMPRVEKRPLCYFMRESTNAWSEYYEKNSCFFSDPTLRYVLYGVTPRVCSIPEFLVQAKQKGTESRGGANKPFSPAGFYKQLTEEELQTIEIAYKFGIRTITCFPVNGVKGDHGVIRFVNLENAGASDENLMKKVQQLSMAANYVYEAMLRVLAFDELSPEVATLSQREQQVMNWAARGRSSDEIGQILSVSVNTVKTHLRHVHKKLGVNNRRHAIAKAVQLRLIAP